MAAQNGSLFLGLPDAGEDISPDRAALSIPEVQQDLAQLIININQACALFCLRRSDFPMPHGTIDSDVLLCPVPFFPAHTAAFPWPSTCKCQQRDCGPC